MSLHRAPQAHPAKRRKTTRPNHLPDLDFGGAPVVQFFSKSKNASPADKAADPRLAAVELELADIPQWRKYISNFTFVPLPGIPYGGKFYPSVEHAFAAAKYDHSKGTGDPPDFSVGSELGKKPNIKTEHSRLGMKRSGDFVMDVAKFDAHKYKIMKELVRSRSEVDPSFRALLRVVRKHGFKLLHFARGGGGGWGGYVSKKDGTPVGYNWLGEIMNELSDELVAQDGTAAGAGGAGASKNEEFNDIRF